MLAMAGGRAGKVTEDTYCRAALAMLAAEGIDGLTITSLCDRVGITKGSFYHHFDDLAGFHGRLLGFWEYEHCDRLISRLEALPVVAERLPAMIDAAVTLPHATEASLRAWARSDMRAADAVNRVDERRERFAVDTMTRLGLPRVQAEGLTRLGLDALVGRQMRQADVDLDDMRASFEEIRAMTFALMGRGWPVVG